jgi:hypothetical protein
MVHLLVRRDEAPRGGLRAVEGEVGGLRLEAIQEEADLLDGPPPQTDESSQLRLLELEQEAAQLRLEVHNLETELTRQRRLRAQERNLNQLATGLYGISRTRR